MKYVDFSFHSSYYHGTECAWEAEASSEGVSAGVDPGFFLGGEVHH